MAHPDVALLDHDSRDCLAPCTPLAIREILRQLRVSGTGGGLLDERGGAEGWVGMGDVGDGEGGGQGGFLRGLRVTIINRSEVVGRPLAAVRKP